MHGKGFDAPTDVLFHEGCASGWSAFFFVMDLDENEIADHSDAVELFQPGNTLCAALDLGQLQRHALSVAAVARSLAAETAWAEDAFLSGLLHDVGFLLLGRQYKNEMQR